MRPRAWLALIATSTMLAVPAPWAGERATGASVEAPLAAPAPASVDAPLPAPAPQLPPVIIVPGAPGTELVDRDTGKRVWPSAWLMVVWNGNDRLALPLDDPESTRVVAGDLLREVHVAGLSFRVPAYDGLEAKLKQLGYTEGDWNEPRGGGEYFYFLYDWRQSVESSGRRFFRALDELYSRLPDGTPPAVVVGHSLGGLLSRYALMYGEAPLGLEGPLPPVTWAGSSYIGTLFLVATPNDGSFTALKFLETGSFHFFHYGAFSPDMLFTFPAAFDMIPGHIPPLIDGDGNPLPFRLDDPDDWERLGWSVVDPRHKSRIPHAALRAHLERELRRRSRMQAALAQVGETPNPVALYALGGQTEPVQRTALVKQNGGRLKVRFEQSRCAGKDLRHLLFEPGDNLVPDRSLRAEELSHGPASSLNFRLVLHSAHSHQGLLSSAEMQAAIASVIAGEPVEDGQLMLAGEVPADKAAASSELR